MYDTYLQKIRVVRRLGIISFAISVPRGALNFTRAYETERCRTLNLSLVNCYNSNC